MGFYDQNIVLDLEFTATRSEEAHALGLYNEVIEIGAVKLDSAYNELGRISVMVKPQFVSGVSGFVHALTGISDSELVSAPVLGDALAQLSSWIGEGRSRVVTWSEADLSQLRTECAAKGIEFDSLPTRWMDIQRLYPRITDGGKRKIALGVAAEQCGIEVERNRAHRALYDADVTAQVLRSMASGDCAVQAKLLRSTVRHTTDGPALSSSLGGRCSGLAGLLASLQEQECDCELAS